MGVSELRDYDRARAAPRPDPRPALPPYGRWLRAGLWIVPLVLMLAVATAFVVTSRQTPTYRSSATLSVVPSAAIADGPDLLRSIETLERRTVIATFAQIPSTERIRQAAAGTVEFGPDSLADYGTRAYVVPNTNLIRIEVEGPDPGRTASLANALVGTTAAEAKAMYRAFEIATLAGAARPTAPVAPNAKRALALAAILGAFLGFAATYLFVHLKRPAVTPS